MRWKSREIPGNTAPDADSDYVSRAEALKRRVADAARALTDRGIRPTVTPSAPPWAVARRMTSRPPSKRGRSRIRPPMARVSRAPRPGSPFPSKSPISRMSCGSAPPSPPRSNRQAAHSRGRSRCARPTRNRYVNRSRACAASCSRNRLPSVNCAPKPPAMRQLRATSSPASTRPRRENASSCARWAAREHVSRSSKRP